MKKWKSLICLLLGAILMMSLMGCQSHPVTQIPPTEHDSRVLSAIDSLKNSWAETYQIYNQRSAEHGNKMIEDKHLQIIHTNVINMKEDIELENQDWEERFESIDYIVEFELLTNYYNTSPYYQNVKNNDCVVVYRDGRSEVTTSIIRNYAFVTYSWDYTPIIESIEDLGSEYNQVIKLP